METGRVRRKFAMVNISSIHGMQRWQMNLISVLTVKLSSTGWKEICHHFLSTWYTNGKKNFQMHWHIWVSEPWSFIPCAAHNFPCLRASLTAHARCDPRFAGCRDLCASQPQRSPWRTSRMSSHASPTGSPSLGPGDFWGTWGELDSVEPHR